MKFFKCQKADTKDRKIISIVNANQEWIFSHNILHFQTSIPILYKLLAIDELQNATQIF